MFHITGKNHSRRLAAQLGPSNHLAFLFLFTHYRSSNPLAMPVVASHTIVQYPSLRLLRSLCACCADTHHKLGGSPTRVHHKQQQAHIGPLLCSLCTHMPSVFRFNRTGKPATVIWHRGLMFGSPSTWRSKSGGREATALPCPGVLISFVFSCSKAWDWVIHPLIIIARSHHLFDFTVTNGQRTHQLGQFDASGLSHLATRLQGPFRSEYFNLAPQHHQLALAQLTARDLLPDWSLC